MSDSDADILSDVEAPDSVVDEVAKITCFFCANTSSSLSALDAHILTEHDFNYTELRKQHDFYSNIRLVNFIRTSVAAGADSTAVTAAMNDTSKFTDEKFLKPVMQEDGLLQVMMNSFADDSESEDDFTYEMNVEDTAQARNADTEVESLRAQVASLTSRLNTMSEVMLSQREGNETKEQDSEEGSEDQKIDEIYFDSYSTRHIHETMLKDKPRTLSYQNFMYENKDFFKDKTVLDIGCGTGILSMFAARAGAKQVIGIDAADIIDSARKIVKTNGLSDVITLVKGKVEEVSLPEHVDGVDIIISEWMGYFLLFESMLPSVLYARDKWLNVSTDTKSKGVYPNKATMSLTGLDAEAFRAAHVDFWKDVYGFDMSLLIDERDRLGTNEVEIVDPARKMTDTVEIHAMDMITMGDSDLDFSTEFRLTCTRNQNLQALCVAFDCMFDANLANAVTLSTEIGAPDTHWKQTVFYLTHDVVCKQGDVIVGSISGVRNKKNNREYDVEITYGKLGDKPFQRGYVMEM